MTTKKSERKKSVKKEGFIKWWKKNELQISIDLLFSFVMLCWFLLSFSLMEIGYRVDILYGVSGVSHETYLTIGFIIFTIPMIMSILFIYLQYKRSKI